MTLSLKGRILLIATVVMLGAMAVVIASTARAFTQEYGAALQSRSLAIGKGLRTQLERLLQFGIGLEDLTGFEDQCEEVISTYPGVEAAMVVTRDGRMLFRSARAPVDRVGDPALLAALPAGREQVVTSEADDDRRFFATVPVHDARGEHRGNVVISVERSQIDQQLLLMLRSSIVMGLLALGAGVLLLYATLSAFVTRPLAGLIATIVKLREFPTDLGRRAAITTSDELGQLGRAFNELMHDLQLTTVSRSALQQAMEQLRATSDALFEQKERAEVTLSAIADAVITTDAQDRVRYMNPVAEQITGWTTASVAGLPVGQVVRLVDAKCGEGVPAGIGPAGAGSDVAGRELDLVCADGRRVGVDCKAALMRDREGGVSGSVLSFRDVSADRAAAQRRSWEATHDVLTGLANRREFSLRLDAAMASARHDGKEHVVCFMDLDRFKVINDTFGHAAGDELLKDLTALMRTKVRQSDTAARLGGDEFALLLEGCSVAQAQLITADLLAAVRDYRYERKGKTLGVGISIGMVPVQAGATPAEVISMADTACYWAKEQGRDRISVYSPGDGDMAARRDESGWVARIESALAQGRFVLYQQRFLTLKPELGDGEHIEVLLRMLGEDGELVQPGSFLPAAERYGLMPAIDRWVISQVFAGYRSLRAVVPESRSLTCAINLSGSSLNADGLIDFIREQAQAHGLPPQAICFEITETAAIHNLRTAAALIRQGKDLGFLFALDDFGIGTSSLGYLKSLPVDFLKIDGSFVRNLEHDRVDRVMTQTINDVAHILGMRTVAEYAENAQVIERLRRMGVDYAQGYGIGRPAPLFAPARVQLSACR